MKTEKHKRSDYIDFSDFKLSFYDMDIYGHMSNINYFKFVDIAVHLYLTRDSGFNMSTGSHIGVIVNSNCDYLAEVSWPDSETIDVGIRVNRLGNSSVEYAGAVFESGAKEASTQVRFTHVWLNRQTRKPETIPADLRASMERILIKQN